jgi:outer membrane protein assembly factor BamB
MRMERSRRIVTMLLIVTVIINLFPANGLCIEQGKDPSKSSINIEPLIFPEGPVQDKVQDPNGNVLASTNSKNLAVSPWPMFRNNLNHTGRSPYNTSKNNGQERWRFTTGASVSSSPAIGPDGTIYFGSGDKNLYAIDPNGTKKWSFPTGDEIISSPAIGSDGTIYFGSLDNNVYAINPDGTKKWNFTTGSMVFSSPAIGSNGTIYIGSDDNNLYAINPDGTKKWNFSLGAYSSPAIGPDGIIYIGSYDTKIHAIYPNGTEKWNYTTGNSVYSSPAIGPDGTIYIGSDDNTLYVLNPNGMIKGSFVANIASAMASSPALGSDGTVYIGSNDPDSSLYALKPDGSQKWKFPTSDRVFSSPAIGSEGTIYVGSYDRNLYAVNPNGAKKWSFHTNGTVASSPAIGSDGTLYVGSWDNNLYAIGTTPSTPPRNLTAARGNAQVALAWKAPADDGGAQITNYAIYKGPASGCETFLAKTGTATGYTDMNLNNGQEYYYEVGAINAAGESLRSKEVNATPATIPLAPQNLTAAPDNTTITLDWDAPQDDGGSPITNYSIYRNGTSIDKVMNVLNYTDTGLINGVNYSYSVAAMNSEGLGPKSKTVYAIPGIIPTAPGNFSAAPGKDRVLLKWTAPQNDQWSKVLYYNLYRGSISGNETLLVKNYAAGLSYIDLNVTVGDTYYYQVGAVNAVVEGPRSSEQQAIPFSNPAAPVLSARSGFMRGELSWSVPDPRASPIEKYLIFRGPIPGGETLYINGSVLLTSWNDTNVTAGTTYYYMVSAINVAGEGMRSNEQAVTPYGKPEGPVLNAKSNNSKVDLSWTVPRSNGAPILSYNIYRGTAQGTETVFSQNYTGGTAWADTKVMAGTTYYYKVSAVNLGGEGPRSNEQSAAPYGAPAAPVLSVRSGISEITLSWTAPYANGSGILGYDIYRGTSAGGETLIVKGYTGGLTWTDKNITGTSIYHYRVVGTNAAGEGPRSNEKIAGEIPGLPTGLSISLGNNAATLSWSAPTIGGAPDGYNIYRASSHNGNYVLIASTTNTEYKDTNVTSGKSYWYKVTAQNSFNAPGDTTALENATPVSKKLIRPGTYNSSFLMGFVLVLVLIIIVVVALVFRLREDKAQKPPKGDTTVRSGARTARKKGSGPSRSKGKDHQTRSKR